MIYSISGLVLFLLGSAHSFLPTNQLETKFILFLQRVFNRKPSLAFFREIWFLGRTPFALVILVLLTCLRWKSGLVAMAVFGITVGLEQLVKGLFNRQRPFAERAEIKMLQPREPHDPSFPSGDTLRIWYLALILSSVLGWNVPFGIGAFFLALLVTLGRLVMGVHYLSDALAGAGLGLLGASTTIWLWHLLQLL